jgi:hypothetical protein
MSGRTTKLAGAYVHVDAARGRHALVDLSGTDGKPMPFGASVVDSKTGREIGIVGEHGVTYLSQIEPDRTRVIDDEGAQSASVMVTNKSEKYPYLIQSWIEDENSKKIFAPLMVLPRCGASMVDQTRRNEKGLTFVIHVIATLVYAVRIAGVRTRRIAVPFSLFGIIALVSRMANSFQGPFTAKRKARRLVHCAGSRKALPKRNSDASWAARTSSCCASGKDRPSRRLAQSHDDGLTGTRGNNDTQISRPRGIVHDAGGSASGGK